MLSGHKSLNAVMHAISPIDTTDAPSTQGVEVTSDTPALEQPGVVTGDTGQVADGPVAVTTSTDDLDVPDESTFPHTPEDLEIEPRHLHSGLLFGRSLVPSPPTLLKVETLAPWITTRRYDPSPNCLPHPIPWDATPPGGWGVTPPNPDPRTGLVRLDLGTRLGAYWDWYITKGDKAVGWHPLKEDEVGTVLGTLPLGSEFTSRAAVRIGQGER